jgi:hypothetical protein
MPSLTKKD